MSNAKRIQMKVAKLKKRKYCKIQISLKIDTLALKSAIRNFNKALDGILNSMKNIETTYGKL